MGLFALQQVFQIYLVYQDRIPLPYELKEIIQSAKRILEEVFEVLVKSRSIGELTFVLVIVAFIPAVVEEALFRGFVQGSLSKYIDPVKAALVSGTIFAFSHLDIINLIPLIALGCYFSVLRMRSNSIIIAMTVHFVNNALAVIAVYFGLNDETFLTGMSGVSANDSLLLSQLVLYVLFFAFCFVAYLRVTRSGTDIEENE
jgi:membrane protease YdiL (CAAX protease family)